MTRFRLTLSTFLFLILGLTGINCGVFNFSHEKLNGGIGGNPMALQFDAVSSQTVTNLTFNPQSVTLYPSQVGGPPVQISLNSQNSVTLGNAVVSISSIQVPYQSYSRLDLSLTPNGLVQNSAQFSNANGNFGTSSSVTVKFLGSFTVTNLTGAIRLQTQAIVNQLGSVNSNSQVKPTLEGTNGQVVSIDAPAFVQLQEISDYNTGTTATTPAFAAPIAAGDFMICMVYYRNPTPILSALSDGVGDTFTRVLWNQGTGGQVSGWILETWTASNLKGGSNIKVVAQFSTAFNGEKDVSCNEYSGVRYATLAFNGSVGSSTNATTGQVLANYSNDLVFGAAAFDTLGSSGNSFTQRSSLRNLVSEDRVISSTGSYSATFLNPAMNWITQVVILNGN